MRYVKERVLFWVFLKRLGHFFRCYNKNNLPYPSLAPLPSPIYEGNWIFPAHCTSKVNCFFLLYCMVLGWSASQVMYNSNFSSNRIFSPLAIAKMLLASNRSRNWMRSVSRSNCCHSSRCFSRRGSQFWRW